MHDTAENWATEQFPPDQRENLAGNTIWHWMVEGFEAGVLAASPSEEKVRALIAAADDALEVVDAVADHPQPVKFRPQALIASTRLRKALAALRTTKEEGGFS